MNLEGFLSHTLITIQKDPYIPKLSNTIETEKLDIKKEIYEMNKPED